MELSQAIRDAAREAVAEALAEALQERLPEPEYLNTQQAAALVGFSSQQLEIWRHRGEGPPFVKLSRAVRYRRAALLAWMDQQEGGGAR